MAVAAATAVTVAGATAATMAAVAGSVSPRGHERRRIGAWQRGMWRTLIGRANVMCSTCGSTDGSFVLSKADCSPSGCSVHAVRGVQVSQVYQDTHTHT